MIYTTEVFVSPYWLNRTSVNTTDYDQVEVMASLSGYPDLPYWMAYYHRKNSPVGYFYGTPSIDDDGDTDIDIILLDKRTFNTTKDRLKYRILAREGKLITIIKALHLMIGSHRDLQIRGPGTFLRCNRR